MLPVVQSRVRDLVSDNTQFIEWNLLSVPVDGYKIFRSNSPESGFQLVGTVGNQVSQFLDRPPITFGVSWRYKVIAFTSTEEGDLASTPPSSDISLDAFIDRPFIRAITGEDVVSGETPIGAKDGINTDFNTFFHYRPKTLKFYRNGQREIIEEINSNTFRILGTPPVSSEVLMVDYWKQ